MAPTFWTRAPAAAVLPLLLACTDIDVGGLRPLDAFEGTWRASHWVIESLEDQRQVDLVDQAGVAFDLTIRSDGGISGVLVAPRGQTGGFESQPFSGTASVGAAGLDLEFDATLSLFGEAVDALAGPSTPSGFTLTLVGDPSRWDFDLAGPGAEVDARATLTLQRMP